MSDVQPTFPRHLTLSNEQLSVLVESIRTITSHLHIDEVLQTIMRNALKVIPEADAGYLMLYDDETQLLTPKAYIQFPQSIENFRTSPNESITGRVFASGKGEFFNSFEDIMEAMYHHNISSSNLEAILASARTPQAAICVPITLDTKPIGIMIIHQLHKKRDLTAEDLLFFQAFADQVGVAIQNARYYEEVTEKMNEVRALSQALASKHELLEQRYNVHTILNQLLLQDESIETILCEIQKLVPMQIGFYNAYDDQFFCESLSLPYYTTTKMKQQLFLKPTPFEYRLKDERSFIIYPLYNLNICLGGLVIENREAISISSQQTLEQGGNVLILKILRNKNVGELYNKRLTKHYLQLLHAPNPQLLQKTASALDLQLDDYYRLCMFELKQSNDVFVAEQMPQQLISILHDVFQQKNKLIYYDQLTITVLIGTSVPLPTETITERIQSLQTKWQGELKPLFRCAISKEYKTLQTLPTLQEETLQTLRFLTLRNKWEIMCYEKIGLNHLLLHVPPRDLETFVADQLGALFEQAVKNDLYETLQAYFQFNRSIQHTAKALHIHSNTLYQRLGRIEQLLDVSLHNSEVQLKLQLACYLKEQYFI
ncbi:MAG: helix-turn-helix domain-containing protein [Solibacillus sp.]